MSINAYSHASTKGTFWLLHRSDGWHIVWDDEDLGTYASPEVCAQEAAGGTCFWPSFGNCALVGLSDELHDWTPQRLG